MKKNGFSLIEMLVVIIIIAFLIALLIPGYLTIYTTMRRNTFDNKVNQIEKGALKYGNTIKDDIKKNTCMNITVQELIERGIISSESENKAEIYNPTTGAPLKGNVVMCYCKSTLDINANYVEDYNPSIYYHKGEKVRVASGNGTYKYFECVEDADPGKLTANYEWTTTTGVTHSTRLGETSSSTTSMRTNAPTNSKYFKEISC